jgi:phosphopantetheine--protein transferase-like protein
MVMEMTAEELREIVARLGGRKAADIDAATPLSSVLRGSLGRVRLEAALRHKLGTTTAGVAKVATFGELCRLLGLADGPGSAPEASPASAQQTASTAALSARDAENGIHVGIDVETIASLPEASDYWEHDFYKDIFSPAEIAYAMLQPSPRATFAGTWCAKEALRKAYPVLAGSPWKSLEVAHDGAGKPSMIINGQPAAGTLSVSHSGDIAVAVFVAGESRQITPAPAPPQDVPPAAVETPKSSRTPSVVSLLALLISIAALVFAFLHR